MSELEQFGVPDFCRKPILVLGIGNTLFGDDGFGCAVVDYVEKHHDVPEAVCLLDAGTSVRKLLFTLCLSPIRPLLILCPAPVNRFANPPMCSDPQMTNALVAGPRCFELFEHITFPLSVPIADLLLAVLTGVCIVFKAAL